MIALPATLLKIFLTTALLTALTPAILHKYKKLSNWVLLSSIIACFIESLGIAYFYIYSGRASWKLTSIGMIDIEFALEPLGIVLINLLTGLWAISTLYNFNDKEQTQDKRVTLLGLMVFTSICLALSKNLSSMFIFYEILAALLLILSQEKYTNQKIDRKFTLFMLLGGAILFLHFILGIYYITGSTEFTFKVIFPNDIPVNFVYILLAMTILGIGKTAIFPINNLFKSSNTASLIFQTIILVNVGLYSITKIIIYIFGIEYLSSILSQLNLALLFSASSLLYASYKIVTSKIIKHILTYSLIAGLCLALISIFALTERSIIAGISHIISHNFTIVALFLIYLRFYNAEGITTLEGLKSLGYKLPIPSIFFVMTSLSLIGIPPFGGANSKKLIWDILLENHYSYIILPIIGLSIIATIYLTGRITYMLFTPSDKPITPQIPSSLDKVIGLALICIVTFPIVEKFLDSILWSIL